MAKRTVFLLLLVFVCVCTACYPGTNAGPVRIIEDDSYLRDFRVEDDTVYISCELSLQNITSKVVSVRINAVSEEDVKTGLLSDPRLTGMSQDTGDTVFTVPPGESITVFVDFCGEYGGTYRKADRLIPNEIEIEVVDLHGER